MTGWRAALLAALCLAGGAARAEDGPVLTGTLKTIFDRGTILIGVRDSAPPFAFYNRAHQPIGFSVDLCHGIAEDAARALNLDLIEPDDPAWQTGLRIAYVPVAAEARLSKVVSGEVDLECGSTTANAERAKTVAFSPIFFLAGTKLMVSVGSDGRAAFASWRELAGRTIAVATGTTTAAVIERLAKTASPPITVTQTSGLDAAYALLTGGQAQAFATDDVLLTGFIETHPGGHGYRVVGDYLSYEPYAILLRRDDPDFAALVQQSFQRMAAEGRLTSLYASWLPNLPISPQLAEMYRALGQPD